MKTKIIYGIAVLAIVAVAAWNVNLSMNQENEMSSMALANVEALAGENDGSSWYKCETKVSSEISYLFQHCGSAYGPYIIKKVDTYSCSSTILGNESCLVGTVTTYYGDCAVVSSKNDKTTSSRCSFF
jgi:hypothetical protein